MTSDTVTIGGAPMYSNRTIVENAMNSPIHTTLVAAVKATGLVGPLSGRGPFTIVLTDEIGGTARVTLADVLQSNGCDPPHRRRIPAEIEL
jgi:hypothetical protein